MAANFTLCLGRTPRAAWVLQAKNQDHLRGGRWAYRNNGGSAFCTFSKLGGSIASDWETKNS
eukprot:10486311-Alexandrium_andersonii.AAC.1